MITIHAEVRKSLNFVFIKKKTFMEVLIREINLIFIGADGILISVQTFKNQLRFMRIIMSHKLIRQQIVIFIFT